MFPNNDPVAFMVAFYGCLLAEVVPVPIEVPLTRKARLHKVQAQSPGEHLVSFAYCLLCCISNKHIQARIGVFVLDLNMSVLSNRMLAASRSASYWVAVGLPWR